MGNSARRDTRTLDNIERNREVLELRRGGKSIREIAETIGIGKSRVHQIIQEELDAAREQNTDAANEQRQLELAKISESEERLELLRAKTLSRIFPKEEGRSSSPSHEQHARLVAAFCKVEDTLTKKAERRARLSGLDAATKAELTGPDGSPLVPHEELLGRLARLAAAGGSGAGDPEPEPGGS